MRSKTLYEFPPELMAELRAVSPEESARRHAEEARDAAERRRTADERRANSPTTKARGLIAVGDSAFVPGKNSTQISASVRNVADAKGWKFSLRTERCLIDGTLRGTRITRIA